MGIVSLLRQIMKFITMLIGVVKLSNRRKLTKKREKFVETIKESKDDNDIIDALDKLRQ